MKLGGEVKTEPRMNLVHFVADKYFSNYETQHWPSWYTLSELVI